MVKMYRPTLVFTFLFMAFISLSQEKPNILWLTCEDMSARYLSTYGGTAIETPNLDAFGENGIKFNNAYSNGSQCSPARTTLITGIYSPALGADWHRRDVRYPSSFPWPSLLKQNGYWTNNKGKTDYNTPEDDLLPVMWTQTGSTFESAPDDVPFFSMENFYTTHMSRITKSNDFANDRTGRTVLNSEVNIPGYLPDMDTLRDDLAWHLDAIKELDEWFGQRLTDLENSGKADNTIVFFFSDHGGSMPGSKGFLRQDGMKVPMMAYFPEKWRHLEPSHVDGISNEIVQFADMGPSMLHLAGIEKPEQMTGRVFCSEDPEPAPTHALGYKTNQGNNFIPARAVTDGNYKLIWNYNTFWPHGVRQGFQFDMPGFREWEIAYRNDQLNEIEAAFWNPQEPFELYNLNDDPEEINNLANDPSYASVLEELKEVIKGNIREIKDLGFNPPSLRDTAQSTTYYEWVRSANLNLESIYEAAELASVAEAADTTQLKLWLSNPNPTIRYWAAAGYARLVTLEKITKLPELVEKILDRKKESLDTRFMCAYALMTLGDYCKSADFVQDNLTSNRAHYVANLKDPGPLAEIMYDFHQGSTGNFEYRSALINTGVMPYRYLYDTESDVILNLDLLSQSDILDDCPASNVSCGAIVETFNGDALPANWTESNSSGQVLTEDGKLVINYDSNRPAVNYTFGAEENNATISFSINSEKNWFRSFALFMDTEGDTLAGLFLGNNGEKNVSVISDLSGIEAGSPTTSMDLLSSDFTKLVDYEVSLTFDFSNHTYSVSIEGPESALASDIPMLHASSNVAAFQFKLHSIFGGSGAQYLDNFGIVANPIDDFAFLESFAAIEDAVYNSQVGDQSGQYPEESWTRLYEYFDSVESDQCFDNQEEADQATQTNDEEYTLFLESVNTPKAESIAITGPTVVEEGSSNAFVAEVLPESIEDRSVTWSVKNESGEASIDQNGQLTAIDKGQIIVIAGTNDGSELYDSVTVEIVEVLVSVSSISISGSSQMVVNSNQTLTVATSPDDATDPSVAWSSSDESLAKVDANGVVSASAIGTVIITATANDGSGVLDEFEIDVTPALATSITIDGQNTMNLGETQTLTIEILPDSATTKTYTLSSSDETMASINASGVVTALTKGTVMITATADDSSGITGTLEITIDELLNVTTESKTEVYPNPSGSMFYLRLSREATISIVDITGKETVKETFASVGKHEIKMTEMQSGVYLLHITYSDNTQESIRILRN